MELSIRLRRSPMVPEDTFIREWFKQLCTDLNAMAPKGIGFDGQSSALRQPISRAPEGCNHPVGKRV